MTQCNSITVTSEAFDLTAVALAADANIQRCFFLV